MTLRVPSTEMVSTIELRLVSSWRTTKIPVPPMPSRRFSTVCWCSSMNACRSAMRRDTREGTVNFVNSAIANFSLWSRTARGELNTLAPRRSASDSSHVLETYSRSKGGSLRISTASNSPSGRVADSCARYQSSSLSASERRVACAPTRFLSQRRCSCSQIQTAWPRACAARIIVTVVSLYALSVSGASMTKSSCRARLLALLLRRSGRRGLLELRAGLVRHENHRARHFLVGQRGVAAARRHRALALDRGRDHSAQAFLEVRRPGSLVADLRRVRHARLVAGGAGRLDDVLALARAGGRRGGAEFDAGDRLDARRDGFRLEGAGIGARLAQHQLDEHDDAEDRNDEGEKDHHNELL